MVDSNPQMDPAQCPSYAAGLGYLGVAAAVCLSNWGSAVGAAAAQRSHGVTEDSCVCDFLEEHDGMTSVASHLLCQSRQPRIGFFSFDAFILTCP